jgi:hypothetical protein
MPRPLNWHDTRSAGQQSAAARYRLTAGQAELDLGLDFAAAMPAGGRGGPLPITPSRMGHLVDVLIHAYRVLGFEQAVSGDEVFGQLVLARIIEPTSKLDSLRVLSEAGVPAGNVRDGQAPPAGFPWPRPMKFDDGEALDVSEDQLGRQPEAKAEPAADEERREEAAGVAAVTGQGQAREPGIVADRDVGGHHWSEPLS